MSSTDLLQEIEALPQDERLWLFERLTELTEAEIPEEFRQSMAEIARAEVIDLDEVLGEPERL